jgi:DNA-binding transcriptional MerR regulator
LDQSPLDDLQRQIARMSMTHSHANGSEPSDSFSAADSPLSIGDMARAFNVSQRTLRFYEDRGLLNPQREGSIRLYGTHERRKLERVLRAKRLGFTLSEIIGFVETTGSSSNALRLDGEQIAQQIAHLERQRKRLDAAIAELRAEFAEGESALDAQG